jgi:hypothetical protein
MKYVLFGRNAWLPLPARILVRERISFHTILESWKRIACFGAMRGKMVAFS